MYLPDWIQKFKEPRTEIRLIKGAFYKYAVEYKYNPTKKRTDKVTLHLMGKITEIEGFIPSNKFELREKASEIPSVDIKSFGVYHLFTSLLEDEIKSLQEKFEPEVSQVLLLVSMVRFAHQAPIKRMSYLHNHDFCSQYWLKSGVDDKKISSVLKMLGENRQLLVNWMQSRLINSEAARQNFVMIDSTNIPTLSENLQVNVLGYNQIRSFDEQIRLMYIFSANLHLPVYYRLINGNITDVKSMKICVNELKINSVIFIADKGFYSKANIDALKEEALHYIVPLHRSNSLIDYTPLQKANFKKEIKTYFLYQGRIIWYYRYEKNNQKMITYLDESLQVSENTDFLTRTKTHPDKYSEADFFDKIHRFGTLTLTYNLPEGCTEQDVYQSYKQRSEIETMFDAYKNFLEADRMYMQDRYVLEGWLMANFVAMTAYYRLFTRLKAAKMLDKTSPKDVVEISKSIFQLKIRNQWVRSEVTKKTQSLFKKIDIDYLN